MNCLGKILAVMIGCLIFLHFALYQAKYGHKLYGDSLRLGLILISIVALSILLRYLFKKNQFAKRIRWLSNSLFLIMLVLLSYLIHSDLKPLTNEEITWLINEKKINK